MSHPKSNLTQYDWACLRVEFMRNRLHAEEWVMTVLQLGATALGIWLIKDYVKDSAVLSSIAVFAVIIGLGVWRHYIMLKPREELEQAERHRDELYFRDEG